MSYDLNIGPETLSHLQIEDGLRELISNALDEHIINEIHTDIVIKKKNNTWIIKDYGRGIKEINFRIQQNEEKLKYQNIIGMFGYGLKDAIGILFGRKVDMKIVTKKYIYIPIICCKSDSDIETIHMNKIKNTSIDIEGDCGTEIHFENLNDIYIEKAKSRFLKFLQPEYLYVEGNNKIFKLENEQSIFVNGVEVYNNTGFHFSYNINSNDKLRKDFNRDRKQIDLILLKKYVESILVKIKLFDQFNKPYNKEFFDTIIDILAYDNLSKLQEFSSIRILRNIISNVNDTELYLFVGKNDKLSKYKESIDSRGFKTFILGKSIKEKFKVSRIKELNNVNIFYTLKSLEKDVKPINTVLIFTDTKKQKQKKINNKIKNAISSIEQHIFVPNDIKDKLMETLVDEGLNDNDYYFSNCLNVSENITDSKLVGVIFQYVLENQDEQNIKSIMINKIGELLIAKRTSIFPSVF